MAPQAPWRVTRGFKLNDLHSQIRRTVCSSELLRGREVPPGASLNSDPPQITLIYQEFSPPV